MASTELHAEATGANVRDDLYEVALAVQKHGRRISHLAEAIRETLDHFHIDGDRAEMLDRLDRIAEFTDLLDAEAKGAQMQGEHIEIARGKLA